MKFSRAFWLILVAGLIITGGVILYMLYQDEIDEQNQVEEQLALAQGNLPGFNSQISDLEAELAQRQAELALVLEELAEIEEQVIDEVTSIEYGDLLYNIAGIVDIQVLNFSSSEPSTTKIDGITYQYVSFDLTVEGYSYDIIAYLTHIEVLDEFSSTIIELVDFNIVGPGEEVDTSQANISIDILAYGGA